MKTLTDNDFHEEVYHHDGPVAVLFSFPGCAPCRTQAKALNDLAKKDGVKVVKVDIGESPEIANLFKVSSLPTTLFFTRGAPRIRLTGVASYHSLRKTVKEAVEEGEDAPAHAH